ncbi:MAG: dihydroxyacetone kinase subunit DhaL, partial [Acidimicrobiales bacterium]
MTAAPALDGDALRAMVAAAADAIDANAGVLSRLDAISGDGDHGANAKRAMVRARALIDELVDATPAGVLRA